MREMLASDRVKNYLIRNNMLKVIGKEVPIVNEVLFLKRPWDDEVIMQTKK